jgi:hypothetical protein
MRILLVSLLAVALWSIDSLGAVRPAAQGDITMKITPSRAQVNLGEYHLARGQRVGVFKKECVGAKLPICTMDRVGSARVTRILNEKYAEITLDPGVRFEEGYVVRRQ